MDVRSKAEFEQLADRFVVRLSGELDLSNAGDTARTIRTAVANVQSAIVADLTRVRYMDSAALRTVWELAEREQERGSKLRVVAPIGSPARQLLDLVDAGQFMVFVDAVEAP